MRLSSIVWVLLVLASPVRASECDPTKTAPQPGDVQVSSSADGLSTTVDVVGFAPFQIYVVVFDPPGGLQGFNLGVSLPLEFTILSTTILDGAPNADGASRGEYIVDLASCHEDRGVLLLTLNCGYFVGPIAPHDVVICPVATDSTPIPGRPVFEDCSGQAVAFTTPDVYCGGWHPDGCLVLNSTELPCPTEATSFGTVKNRFGRR